MSNNQPAAWQYKEVFQMTYMEEECTGHYEVTNGDISLCTTDDPENITESANSLQLVAKALNESGCKFYVNTATEHALYVESELLISALEDIARQMTCAETEADEEREADETGSKMGDIEGAYDTMILVARQALKQINDGRKK